MKLLTTYMDSFLNSEIVEKLKIRKEEVFEKLMQADMNGWLEPDISFLPELFKVRDDVLSHSQCLVVIGIGGSYLGSQAFYSIFTPYFTASKFPIIYAGTTLSSNYMSELLEYLKDVDFSVNVISKSGSTMEVSLIYSAIKKVLESKYDKEELKRHIIITTDASCGPLREEALREGYYSFSIPSNIGGRYSLLTPAHLFPLSFCLDIQQMIDGYLLGLQLKEEAFSYAVRRVSMFYQGKVVENFVSYESNWSYYLEWLKQLFGETEGKDGKGILPISMIHTRDLHSLGQFVQEGNKIMFETFFKVNQGKPCQIHGRELQQINLTVEDAVISAHVSGRVPALVIELDQVTPKSLGELSSFYFLVASYSGYLFDINPFNQPGVEVYKSEVKKRLGWFYEK